MKLIIAEEWERVRAPLLSLYPVSVCLCCLLASVNVGTRNPIIRPRGNLVSAKLKSRPFI
jgi:hypothetical protein